MIEQSIAEYRDNFYTLLAKRLYVSRDFVKREMYMLSYGGVIDPWVHRIMLVEELALTLEKALVMALKPEGNA